MAFFTRKLAEETHILALETKRLAAETLQSVKAVREATEAEDRRHKDEFMPHIALEARDEILELAGKGILQRFTAVYAKNIGVGFAQQIAICQNNMSSTSCKFFVYPPPPALGVGDKMLLIAKEAGPNTTFLGVTLTYQDAFGNKFESMIPDGISPGTPYTARKLDA